MKIFFDCLVLILIVNSSYASVSNDLNQIYRKWEVMIDLIPKNQINVIKNNRQRIKKSRVVYFPSFSPRYYQIKSYSVWENFKANIICRRRQFELLIHSNRSIEMLNIKNIKTNHMIFSEFIGGIKNFFVFVHHQYQKHLEINLKIKVDGFISSVLIPLRGK
jgi:hypothetical protein